MLEACSHCFHRVQSCGMSLSSRYGTEVEEVGCIRYDWAEDGGALVLPCRSIQHMDHDNLDRLGDAWVNELEAARCWAADCCWWRLAIHGPDGAWRNPW